MAAMRGGRVPVGSATWIADERASALSIAQSEAEEFSFSVRNDFDWLNEHMADVFNENEINVAEIFKTPGKLRGKTPRTARKAQNAEPRVPLSDIFSSASKGAQSPFMQKINRLQSPKNQPQNTRSPLPSRTPSPLKPAASSRQQQQHHHHQQQYGDTSTGSRQGVPPADSGYHGSQVLDTMEVDQPTQPTDPIYLVGGANTTEHVASQQAKGHTPQSPAVTRTIHSPTASFQTAKEEQTTRVMKDVIRHDSSPATSPSRRSPVKNMHAGFITSPHTRTAQDSSPIKSSPLKATPTKAEDEPMVDIAVDPEDASQPDDARSASEASSPIRPVVRKSSLNFASLPAREPLSKKSMGGHRVSQDNRASYYGRLTGGKSLGNVTSHADPEDDDDFEDRMVMDDMEEKAAAANTRHPTKAADYAEDHNKAYTQRLQDQINLLGKSQSHAERPSKSISNPAMGHPVPQPAPAPAPTQSHAQTDMEDHMQASPSRTPLYSPSRNHMTPHTPGAFPEEDENDDDWIAPPTTAQKGDPMLDVRPSLPKSYSADVMEGIHGTDTISGAEFALPKQRLADNHAASPQRPAVNPGGRVPASPVHGKSASMSELHAHGLPSAPGDMSPPKKGISVSNPTLASVPETDRPQTPSKSPAKGGPRDSPLKQVKNKLSSIIKSSRGLLASSAAISAEGKSSMLSPSTTRLGYFANPSTDTLAFQTTSTESLYPDLTKRQAADTQTLSSTASPSRPKRTRASVEREKEEKRKEKEAQKEARRMAEQMDKLEKAREKEREKARVFSKEQDRIAAMEKKVAEQKEQIQPPQTLGPKETARPTRTSPRKAKAAQPESATKPAGGAADGETTEATMASAAPTPAPHSAQAARGREIRRPVKPATQPLTKPRQAPTVIRVNTGSQHSQYHPSTSALSSNLRDTLGPSQPQQQLKSKASQASLHTKPSLQSLKGSASTSGRPKALELAAKRKEQEEKDAQKKREAKLEMERKRATALEEERRQEQQRRQEAEEQQREREREQAARAEAKKTAQRQAAIEKAKQTRAPPPAVRSQPNGPPDHAAASNAQGPRPPSRITAAGQRTQEDGGRPANSAMTQGSKALPKRPLPQDGGEGGHRNQQARNGPSYQAKDAKRRRTSDDFFDELDIESQPPNIKGPPVRPSSGLKRDVPQKPGYGHGYGNVPAQSSSRDLFKSTVTASAAKATQGVDMTQFSKGAIPFAPNPNPAGNSYKTPVRAPGAPAGKSTAKSAASRASPRFQNGESIELPEIQTDDDDEDEDDGHIGVAAWADSPDLRRALARQETMDPSQIFGPPAPLVMEEVFNKTKDRWHKFRQRTSSANWSGADRLTEEDIRKDLAARDKMRKQGAWSYELSKDLA